MLNQKVSVTPAVTLCAQHAPGSSRRSLWLLGALSALIGFGSSAQAQVSTHSAIILNAEKGADIRTQDVPLLLQAKSPRLLNIIKQVKANPHYTKQILTDNHVEWCGTMEAENRLRQSGIRTNTNNCTKGSADLPANRDSLIPTATTPFKTIRVKVNLFAYDDGSSPVAPITATDAQIQQLNADYAAAHIRFINNGTRIINSTRFRNPTNGTSEVDAMKSAYNVDPAHNLNMYIFDAAGFDPTLLGKGYFAWDDNPTGPLGGFFADNDAFGAGQKTATHEIGHVLGLWHPHYGVSDIDSATRCTNVCAEFAGRSVADGDTTGDLCSDTPPTPRNFDCTDPGTVDTCNNISWGQTDFHNFMGYANDPCMSHFTPQQMGRMHGWINNVLTGWLVTTTDNYPPVVTVPNRTETPTLTGNKITISFSKAMNTATTQAAFRFAPALAGTYAWSNGNQTVTFTPTAPTSGTYYQVTILGTAPSSANAALTLDGNFDNKSEGSTTDDYTFSFHTTGSLSNDMFSKAQLLSGNAGSAIGSNVGATLETNEPQHGSSVGGASVWYKWVAPATGNATFDTRTSSFDTALAVYTGGSVGTLTQIESNEDEDEANHIYTSRLTFRAIAGTTYYIAVDGYKAANVAVETGNIKLTWNNLVSPANDFWANAQVLTGAAGSTTGTTIGAYDELNEPYYSNKTSGVWYKWVAPFNGAAYFDTEGSDFDTNINVFTGTSVGQLTEQESDDDSGTGSLSNVPFTMVSGTTYYIAVSGGYSFDGARGNINLNWHTVAAPSNDPFASPIVITGAKGGTTGSNIGASSEANEPYGAGSPKASVWYKWTAPANGTVTMDTFGSGNNENVIPTPFDTVLNVYTGTTLSALTEVVANNDAVGVVTSQVKWTAVAGKSYYIDIDAGGYNWRDAHGRFALNWKEITAPANDMFANATLISGQAGKTGGTNLGASSEVNEPYGAGSPKASVWFKWTAPTNGMAIFDTAGSGNNQAGTPFDTVLNVFTGSSVGALTQVVTNNDDVGVVTSKVKFTAVGGTTYYFDIDAGAYNYDEKMGDYALNWKLIPAPANDLFANRALLSGSSGRFTGTNIGANSEVNEPYGAGSPKASVWFKWTAPSAGTVVFDTAGSGNDMAGTPFDTVLNVSTGSALNSLTQVTTNNDDTGVVTSKVSFTATAGTTYIIDLDAGAYNYDEKMGSYLLNWSLNGVPINTPSVTSFTPQKGVAGTTVVITGTSFIAGATTVKFNGTTATATVNSTTKITATVPSGATTGPISVTTANGTGTSADNFTMGPSITSFTPLSGAIGATVTITGTNFTGVTSVKFNATEAAAFTVVSTTQITAIVPTGATTGKITVTNDAGSAVSAANFTPGAWIGSLAPVGGAIGSTVVINGGGFTNVTGVTFNNGALAAAAYTVNSTTKITATVPTGALTNPITVATALGTAVSPTDFVIYPGITSFTPTIGRTAANVVITGTNFTGAMAVKFGGVDASFVLNSVNKITAKVPVDAKSGKITVVTPVASVDSATRFTVDLTKPTIFIDAPLTGGAHIAALAAVITGTVSDNIGITNITSVLVWLRGKINGSTQYWNPLANPPSWSATIVKFPTDAARPSTDSTWSYSGPLPAGTDFPDGNYTLTAVAIDGAGNSNSRVNNLYVKSTATTYSISGQITLSGTTTGVSGVKVTRTGSATPATTNASGNFSLTGVTGGTYTLTPALTGYTFTPASKSVTVGTANVGSANFVATSQAPAITSFTPTSGTAGTIVTVTGTKFTGATAVTFNGVTATFNTVTATSLKATAPAGVTTGPISITTPSGTGTSATSFTATSVAPTITSFTPTTGAAGTAVTVTGTNLTGTTAVKFNGKTATFNTVTATSLKATAPAGVTTGKISITTPNGTATSTANFTASSVIPTITSFTPTSGAAGTIVTVTGTNLTGTTAVKFNGTTATFNTVTATSLKATVPAAATTGKITITTPNGTATSAGTFTVTGGTDTTSPTVTVTAPIANHVYSSLSTASGTASDAGTGVNSVYLALAQYDVPGTTLIGWWDWVNQIWITDGSNPNILALATGTTSWSKSLPSVAAGNYEVWVTALDNSTSGNQAPWVTAKFQSSSVSNDNFANAQVLTGNSGTTAGSNIGATKETGEPNHHSNVGGASIWYRWTAPSDGSLTVDSIGSNFDTIMGVYTGTSVSALTTIGSDDDSGGQSTSSVTINVIGGTIYRIAVDGYNLTDPAEGTVKLNWAFGAALAPKASTNALSSSSVHLSTASSDSENATITLVFDGAIAEGAADATHYAVTINGVAIEVQKAAYSAGANQVVLSLPATALHSGDRVKVTWTNVPDAQSQSISGSTKFKVER